MIYIYDWWFGTRLLLFHILGMSSSQLTNSFFFRGLGIPPTRWWFQWNFKGFSWGFQQDFIGDLWLIHQKWWLEWDLERDSKHEKWWFYPLVIQHSHMENCWTLPIYGWFIFWTLQFSIAILVSWKVDHLLGVFFWVGACRSYSSIIMGCYNVFFLMEL